MEWIFNDGGRKEAGYKGAVGDCAVRAISIITGKNYQEVYDALNLIAKKEKVGKRKKKRSNAREGVFRYTVDKYLFSLGYSWVPTMKIGQGCKVHLKADELPKGKLIVRVSRHYVAVIDSVIYDTYDCSRDEERCVYGYYYKKD